MFLNCKSFLFLKKKKTRLISFSFSSSACFCNNILNEGKRDALFLSNSKIIMI